MMKTLKKGVWCWPCLDATGDRVQAVEEIEDDPYCEVCANKERKRLGRRGVWAERKIDLDDVTNVTNVQIPEPEPEVAQPELQPTAAIHEDVAQPIEAEPEVVHPQTGVDDGPPDSILRHRQTRRAAKREHERVTILKAESDEDHEANQAFAALNCEDKWALIEAVLA